MRIRLAGLTVEIENKHPHVERLARDYLTSGEPDFSVRAEISDIERERALSDEPFSDGYLESVVIYRKIAEELPRFGAFVLHGAVIALDGAAYAFTARSGVGKTTHTRLWLKKFGSRAEYINGDKPIIRFIDGVPYAFGTPWMGKESYGANISAPVSGIVLLERAPENIACPISADEASEEIIKQTYIPKRGASALAALALVSDLLSRVRLVRLCCNTDISSVDAAAGALGIEL